MKWRDIWIPTAIVASLMVARTGALAGQDEGGEPAYSMADIEQGRQLFIQNCNVCHGPILNDPDYGFALFEGARLVQVIAPPYGPNLTGVIGRQAGIVEDFYYSSQFREYVSGLTWEPETLDTWIMDSQAVAPGATMYYSQPDPEVRSSIIGYLVHFD